MKSTILTILIILTTYTFTHAQLFDFRNDNNKHDLNGQAGDSESEKDTDLFKAGQFDIGQNGMTQAGINILRLRIGEPNGFNIPLYIALTSTGPGLGSGEDQPQATLARFIIPTGGLINVAINDSKPFSKMGPKSALSYSYHLGYKLNSGIDSLTLKNELFSSAFFDAGIRFVTGAWVEDDTSKLGLGFIQIKAFATFSSESTLRNLINSSVSNVFAGISGDAGIFIKDYADLRFSISALLNNENATNLDKYTFNFAVDYKFGQ